MEKKKTKGFFRGLFSPKSGSHCCNIHFEEIIKEDTAIDEKTGGYIKNNNVVNKLPDENNKQIPS